MGVAMKKSNPGFLSDEGMVASFCVRKAELETLLRSLKSSDGESSVHSLVIGPRGSGKTHLLLRLASEMRRNASLSIFYPIVFSEEMYDVATVGEFWLECLNRLAEQAPDSERDSLRLSHDDLRPIGDDRLLAERCLGSILNFAGRIERRLVLIVENLNMLLAAMRDPDAGWRIRHTLQTEPRIVLFGSATSRFDEIDHPDHALYGFFQVSTLHPLGTRECADLWSSVTGQPAAPLAVRPMEILTGGNPRLLAILGSFGADRPFRGLLDNLLDLVDDQTDHFRGHLESLPALERRVYLSLARLWRPATAREVADQSRLDINRCSALLARLVDRGAVTVVGGTPRRRRYYLTERFLCIHHLMRRDGGPNGAVGALTDFMSGFYRPSESWDICARIFRESLLETDDVHEPVTQALIRRAQTPAAPGYGKRAIAALDRVADGAPMAMAAGARHSETASRLEEILALHGRGEYAEGIIACDRMVAIFGTCSEPAALAMLAAALDSRGRACAQLGSPHEAVRSYDRALECLPAADLTEHSELVADILIRKGLALMQGRDPDGASAAFDEVVASFGTAGPEIVAARVTDALLLKASALLVQGRVIPEGDFSLLLRTLATERRLRPGHVQALAQLAEAFGVSRALELIETSPAADLLLPLVTALRHELGRETHVAMEVNQVAFDVRGDLARVSREMSLGE